MGQAATGNSAAVRGWTESYESMQGERRVVAFGPHQPVGLREDHFENAAFGGAGAGHCVPRLIFEFGV